MLLGNPYKFAIIIEKIEEWNLDETFRNGVLLVCVDGSLFPKEILTATLNSEINPLKESLGNIAVNEKIFTMEKEEAFEQIYNITFPEDVSLENDYRFDITPLLLCDNNCYIFAVSDGVSVRILAAKLEYRKEWSRHLIKNADISETFISIQEMEEIAKDLIC